MCVFGEVGTQKKEGWLHSVEHRVHRHHTNLLYTFLSMLISSKIQLPRFALKGEKVTRHSLWQFHSSYALSCISEWGYMGRQEEWVTNSSLAVLTLSLKWPGACPPSWTVCCVMGLRNECLVTRTACVRGCRVCVHLMQMIICTFTWREAERKLRFISTVSSFRDEIYPITSASVLI